MPIEQVRKLFSACAFVRAWCKRGVSFVDFHSHPVLKCGTCLVFFPTNILSVVWAVKVLICYSEKLFLVDGY